MYQLQIMCRVHCQRCLYRKLAFQSIGALLGQVGTQQGEGVVAPGALARINECK